MRAQSVRRVCQALLKRYGKPRLRNPKWPLDDLIFIIISNKTAAHTAVRTYLELRRRFPQWDDVLTAHYSVLRGLLKPAGLSAVKSKQIRAALRKISNDFGRCSLRRLRRLCSEDAEFYLRCLPGASEKVAKCVMMYTLDAPVLPVDGHVHRIATRLGWTARKRADQCHAELESLVAPHRRYAFHVDCVVHGRAVCRPSMPACGACCIRRYCDYKG